TSIPASRSACATTVTPTVCVSMPSLASRIRSRRPLNSSIRSDSGQLAVGRVHSEYVAHCTAQFAVRRITFHCLEAGRDQVAAAPGRLAHLLKRGIHSSLVAPRAHRLHLGDLLLFHAVSDPEN